MVLRVRLSGGLLAFDQVVERLIVTGGLKCGFIPHGEDDAAELGAPIADVVLADDVVAEEF